MKKIILIVSCLFVAILGVAQTTGEISTEMTLLRPEMVDQSQRWLAKMPQVLRDARVSFIRDGYLSYEDIQNGVEQIYLSTDHVGIFIRAHASAVTSELLEISSGQTIFKYKGKYIYPYCLNEFADLRPALKYVSSEPKAVDPIYCRDSISQQIVDKCYGQDGFTKSEIRITKQPKEIGCGNIVYVFGINVLPIYASTDDYSFIEGDSVEVNEIWHTTDTMFVDSLQTVSGCDSLVTTKINMMDKPLDHCKQSLHDYRELGQLDVGASVTYGSIPMMAESITSLMFRPAITGGYRIPVIMKNPCLIHEIRLEGAMLINNDHEVYHPSACGCKNVGESGNIIITATPMWTTTYLGWMRRKSKKPGKPYLKKTPVVLTAGIGFESKYHAIDLEDTNDFMFYPVGLVEGKLFFSDMSKRNFAAAHLVLRSKVQFTETKISHLLSLGIGITL